ncbi:hypothetical protein [Stratiformator vulcanicus]|uniref:Uncharacterized protein n=1 Tax=Stratiformator vulcanicus TaxID=2527980 RepID=A0A517R759_9PLAN|nr:hypothetical protein [Stratiformator vulcanicus]QDT39715.1 hypothetical protein Pan189_41240 [Stratiformator vulcanicus]
MKTYSFDVTLPPECGSVEFADWLYASGGDDCTLSVHAGVPTASVHREARSLEEAIRSFAETLGRCGPHAKILSVSVDGDDLASILTAG